MDLVLLTSTIIKMIVTDKEAVSVKEFETTDENLIQLEVVVANEELSKVIGKNGKTINSIRNIIQVSATINCEKKVKINVDSY